MAVEQDLLAAIHADPDNDAPRLVYADWLQQRGDPLGEYITIAIERERAAPDDPRLPLMTERLRELGMSSQWLSRFRQHPRHELGMPAAIALRRSDLRSDLTTRLQGTMIRDLTLHGLTFERDELAVLERAFGAMRLRRLHLFGSHEVDRLAALFTTPGLEGLNELRLNDSVLDEPRALVLANTRLPALERLFVDVAPPKDGSGCGDSGAEAFAASAERQALRELWLPNQGIGPDGIRALVDGRRKLTSLGLSGNPLGLLGVQALAEGVRTPLLESLAIAGTKLDLEAVRLLARNPAFAGLRRLTLAAGSLDSGLPAEALEVLAASPYLARDLRLELDGLVLGLSPSVTIDGMSGEPSWSSWEGVPPAFLTNRFKVEVVGWPPLE